MTNKPIKIVRNRWYYSDDVYINVCAGYYELCEAHGHIRSFSDLSTAIDATLFQVRFSS